MIKFINVKKSFGQQTVHKDINLTIPKGKITYIIGPSGTGKSVLIKELVGLIKPTAGDILINDESIINMNNSSLLKLRKKIGFLFQNAALFDYMDVYGNVSFPLKEHTDLNNSEIKRIVSEKLAQVGLSGVESKYPSELSGGMRKRVGLARALALEPEIMLYDEPTTGLDPIMTDVVDELILSTQLNKEDRTSLVVSHDIKSTLKYADYIAMLYDGVIVASGDSDFFRKSDNPMIVQFFNGSKAGPIKI